jgi:hypothetical protein
MAKQSKWFTLEMKCPEGKGESKLLVEWRGEGGKEVLKSISCDNLYLRDLSGGDCEWSCWEEVSREEN